eukprot:4556916-Prymnesium_polylepis.1
MVGTGTGVPRSEKELGGTGYFSAELSVGFETLIFLPRKRLESPVRHWLPLGAAASISSRAISRPWTESRAAHSREPAEHAAGSVWLLHPGSP